MFLRSLGQNDPYITYFRIYRNMIHIFSLTSREKLSIISLYRFRRYTSDLSRVFSLILYIIVYYVYLLINHTHVSDTQFQNQVLLELQKLNGRFDTLEGKVDVLATKFREFKTNQEQFNAAIWALNTQSFSTITDLQGKTDDMQSAVHDIRLEVVSPWKLRQPK